MDFINHYDNGTSGLRIATFVAIGEIVFWCTMYLAACAMRATATRIEAAQLYINNNTEDEDQYDE